MISRAFINTARMVFNLCYFEYSQGLLLSEVKTHLRLGFLDFLD